MDYRAAGSAAYLGLGATWAMVKLINRTSRRPAYGQGFGLAAGQPEHPVRIASTN
jgi:hypothetical protein